VFSTGSGPRLYNESLFVALNSPVAQLERECPVEEGDSVSVNCCNQLYKNPINSLINSKSRCYESRNPGHVTILTGTEIL
jgi:hypothetical protein